VRGPLADDALALSFVPPAACVHSTSVLQIATKPWQNVALQVSPWVRLIFDMNKLPVFLKVVILGLLALCVACAIWFLCRPDPAIWRLRTSFHLGMSVAPAAVIEGSTNLQRTIESHFRVVALISNPVFRDTIAGTSEFLPGSAGLSKRLVFETLRAHVWDSNVEDIEIDLTAASAADCLAAYRTIARQIEQRHALLFDENARQLQTAIDDYRERAAQLAKWGDAKLPPGDKASTDADSTKTRLALSWSETREHLRQLEAVKSLMTPTTFPPEAEVYVEGPLVNNTVRLSALAGLAVILCAILLAWTLDIRASRSRNTNT
jgi:hypothetical protein